MLFHSSLRTSRVSTHPPSLDLSPSCTEKRSSFFITAKQGKIRIYTFLLYPIFYLQRLHLNLENAQLQVFFFIISNSRRRVCRSGFHTLWQVSPGVHALSSSSSLILFVGFWLIISLLIKYVTASACMQELRQLRDQLHYAADYSETTFLNSKEKKMWVSSTSRMLFTGAIVFITKPFTN